MLGAKAKNQNWSSKLIDQLAQLANKLYSILFHDLEIIRDYFENIKKLKLLKDLAIPVCQHFRIPGLKNKPCKKNKFLYNFVKYRVAGKCHIRPVGVLLILKLFAT